MASPLDGVKVVAITGVVAGPTLGWILADFGAEVTNIESSTALRLSGYGAPAQFVTLNRNKKGIGVDLKNPKGKEILTKLVAKSDVLIENLGPGAVDRLGFSYEAVKEMNPKMIYCSIKGFATGPYENRLGYDNALQAETGLLYMTGGADEPKRIGASAIDMTAAIFSALGIVLALRERDSTGKGKSIESGLFESAAYLMSFNLCGTAVRGASPPHMNTPGMFYGIYDCFTTADNKKVFVGVTTDKQWQRFCEEFKLEEFLTGEKFETESKRRTEGRPIFMPKVKEIFAKSTREELMERFEKCNVVFAPVNAPLDVLDHPQLKAPNKTCKVSYAGFDKPVDLVNLPVTLEGFTPPQTAKTVLFGENNEEVLLDLGYTKDEIASLAQEGVLMKE